jgi:hypothetical protein
MRKTEVFIGDSGRDTGKVFLLKEMSADRAEKWAARALNALAASGVQVPDGAGLSHIAAIGFDSFRGLPWEQVEPLLDEMFSCVQRIPDPEKKSAQFPFGYSRPLMEDDIEEVLTRLKMRGKILELHLGFSIADALSTLRGPNVGKPQTNTGTSLE